METQIETSTPANPLAIKFPDLKETLDKIGWASMPFEELPSGRACIAVMGESGDTKHIWDKSKPDEVEAARTLFNGLKKKGYRGYRVTDKEGSKGEQMNEFDPEAERFIMIPQMQGG